MFLEKNLHHAYVCVGQKDFVISSLEPEFEKIGIKIRGNPDYFKKDYGIFGIDEAREIKDLQTKKSALSGKKIFIISFDSITREAQNSLLKVFEEPTEDTHFFVIASSISGILETLLSRVSVIEFFDKKKKKQIEEHILKFVLASPAQRLIMLEDTIENKNKKELLTMIDFLIEFSAKNKQVKSAGELMKLKKYLEFKSSSVKMIAEHLSLTFPNISVHI